MVLSRTLLSLTCLGVVALVANAWAPNAGHSLQISSRRCQCIQRPSYLILKAAADGKKKRKRRRKQPPPPPGTAVLSNGKVGGSDSVAFGEDDDDEDDDDDELDDILTIADVANYKFKSDEPIDASKRASEGEPIPLPDIRDTLKRKEMEEEMARVTEEQEQQRPKIKRSDREAFVKLLEQQPYADADDSFFEAEKYSVVSALLGEGAKSFLGIPFGPLQVGHFIGALGISLMAFIEYPGFPLTNLPTPLRDALQGGLASVYAINLVLAVAAIFKAGERGQPQLLWASKTFFVGGLAFDQLTQLPTLSETANMAKSKTKGGRKKK